MDTSIIHPLRTDPRGCAQQEIQPLYGHFAEPQGWFFCFVLFFTFAFWTSSSHTVLILSHKTRVPLPAIEGDECSTYYNANFVRGSDGNPKRYVAAMGSVLWLDIGCYAVTHSLASSFSLPPHQAAAHLHQQLLAHDLGVQRAHNCNGHRPRGEGQGQMRALLARRVRRQDGHDLWRHFGEAERRGAMGCGPESKLTCFPSSLSPQRW